MSVHSTHKQHVITSSYIDAFSPERLQAAIAYAAPKVFELADKHNFTALLYTGQSGAAYAWPLSLATGIPVACLRKKDEHSHSGRNGEIEGAVGDCALDIRARYCFVDDFIGSGNSLRRAIDAARKQHAEVVCAILLQHERDGTEEGIPTYGLQAPRVPVASADGYSPAFLSF